MIFHLLLKACCDIEVFNICDVILMVNLECFRRTVLTFWTNGSMLCSL
jgi:hypothetical protein